MNHALFDERFEGWLAADFDAFAERKWASNRFNLERGRVRSRLLDLLGQVRSKTALQDGLELEHDDLAISWQSLASAGNLSSASVLMILSETLKQRPAEPGEHGVMLAMGPGFCSEFLLLRW